MFFRFIAAIRNILGKVEAGSPTQAMERTLAPLLDDMKEFIHANPHSNEGADMAKRLDNIEDMFEEAWFDGQADKIVKGRMRHISDPKKYQYEDVVTEVAEHIFVQGLGPWVTRQRGGEPFTIHNIDRPGVGAFFRTMADNEVRGIFRDDRKRDKKHVEIMEEMPDEGKGSHGKPIVLQVPGKDVQTTKDFDVETREMYKHLKKYIAEHSKKGQHSFEYLMFLTLMRLRDQGNKKITTKDILGDKRITRLGLTEPLAEKTWTNLRKLLCDYFDKVLHHPLSEQQQREWGLRCGAEVTRRIMRKFAIRRRIAAAILFGGDEFQTPDDVVTEIRKERKKEN